MIVVIGASGQLGTALQARLGPDALMLSEADLDLSDLSSIAQVVAAADPSILINAAAYTNVDKAEEEPDVAMRVNGEAVGVLAAAARTAGAQFVTVSTDYVFDGTADRPYVESDPTNPVNAYGTSKLAGERAALDANPETLVVRTSWLMSGTHRNFADTILRLTKERELTVVDDQFGHPTLASDLAGGILDAASKGVTGVLHLTNQGVTTWFDLARELVTIAGGDVSRVQPCATSSYPTAAKRPANSVLDSVRTGPIGLAQLPDYHEGLADLVAELKRAD
ncbi:MAG: dTDP-4-dehydrorhamnose reductase [Acidimicrobiia bacterium]|nr:MAG: dTDP-4-dehydrorhamnose reductase [Acidimicrobiia bacterium]